MPWEYRTISLYLGTPAEFGDWFEEVQAAGREGWEAVGEIHVLYPTPRAASGNNTSVRLLLFKRPLVGTATPTKTE